MMTNVVDAIRNEISDYFTNGYGNYTYVKYGEQEKKHKCKYCGTVQEKDQCPACGAWRKQ